MSTTHYTITDTELLTELHRLADELGHPPTQLDMREHGKYSYKPYEHRFGSWNNALETAGLEPRNKEPDHKIPVEDLIDEIHRLADEHTNLPTLRDMRENGKYYTGTYYDRFGSWNNALEKAGLETRTNGRNTTQKQDTEPNHNHQRGRNPIPKQDLLDEIHRLADEHNTPPTTTDLQEHGKHSYKTYQTRFGSWGDAVKAAGYEPQRNISDEALIEEIHRLAVELGHTPTVADMEEHGNYGQNPYYDRFGSWSNAVEQATTREKPGEKPSRNELLHHIHIVANKIGERPSRRDIQTHGEYSHTTYYKRFGSWDAALEAAGYDPQNDKRKIPVEDLIDEIHRLADELGHTPTTTEMNEHGKYGDSTYSNRFGTWDDALTEAGLEPRHGNKIPDDDLINELHRLVDELGHTPTVADMQEHGQYSGATYQNRFGSWNNAIEQAGLEPNTGPDHKIPTQDLIDEIHRLAVELGHTPTGTEMREHGEYSTGPYYDRFGSWGNALEEAGYEPRPNNHKIPKQDLLDELHHLANELGHTPTFTEMREHGEYSTSPYYDRFGSWNNALETAGLEPHTNGRKTIPKQDLINEIHRLAVELGHTPTTTDMQEHGQYSQNPYTRRFESWDDALTEAGLEPRHGNKIPDDDLINELHRLVDELGHTPTTTDMQEHGKYSITPYYDRFGSWTDAVKTADLER